MVPIAIEVDPLVVSVLRQEQPALEAPASISVVHRRKIERSIALTALDHVRTETGVDLAAKGLTQNTYAARGGRSSNSGSILTLQDNRYAGVPSLRFNVPYLIPSTDDDIERIEVMRGPAAALYGPNSTQGVLHIITRSPFESEGTDASVVFGERSVFQGSFRHAEVVGHNVAVKIAGNYFRGDDWEYVDSTESERRARAIAGGADPDTLLVGRRDFGIERVTGHARLDWRTDDNTLLILTGGLAQAINNVDMTDVGATQVRDWRYQYAQAQLRWRRLFANVLVNFSDAGESYQLRTGAPIVDNSRVLAAQLQHGTEVANRHDVVYGVDVRHTVPRTGGTIHGRNEADDNLNELGAYVHSSTTLSPQWDLTGAVRVDYHDRINNLAISPRAAIVFKPRQTHAVRLTYNRAHTSPSAQGLFIDLAVDSFPGLPYAVRWRGKPKGGFSFRRDCSGGMCMYSPFNPAGPAAVLPADATLAWPVVIAALQQEGIDISGIPAPSAVDVGTDLRALNIITGAFDQVSRDDVRDIEADRRTMSNVVEVGYKGVIKGRALVTADFFHTRVSDVLGDVYTLSPNVFLNQASLEQYLGRFLPTDQAGQLSAMITQMPVGTVSPEEAGDADVTLVERQGGAYSFWGLDVSITANITPTFSLYGSYSWASRDSIPDVNGAPVFLNVPKHKGAAALEYDNDEVGFQAGISVRAVAAYPVVAGVFRGEVESYALFDIRVGYELPWVPGLRITVDAHNIFDNRHQEFPGAPLLGRMVMSRLHVSF
jgi:iron complex outermembrane receptor protein